MSRIKKWAGWVKADLACLRLYPAIWREEREDFWPLVRMEVVHLLTLRFLWKHAWDVFIAEHYLPYGIPRNRETWQRTKWYINVKKGDPVECCDMKVHYVHIRDGDDIETVDGLRCSLFHCCDPVEAV